MFSNFSNIKSINSVGSLEFFNIGYPGKSPISPVGTILIAFNNSFLLNNMEAFVWGCVGDNGGIKNGFNPYIKKENYKNVRLSYEQILKILEVIENLPAAEKEKVLMNKKSLSFIEKTKKILPFVTINSILKSPEESSRKIEFCLKGNIRICDQDIYKIIIPNTYKNILPRKNFLFSRDKIRYYNPKNHPLLEI